VPGFEESRIGVPAGGDAGSARKAGFERAVSQAHGEEYIASGRPVEVRRQNSRAASIRRRPAAPRSHPRPGGGAAGVIPASVAAARFAASVGERHRRRFPPVFRKTGRFEPTESRASPPRCGSEGARNLLRAAPGERRALRSRGCDRESSRARTGTPRPRDTAGRRSPRTMQRAGACHPATRRASPD
jgi:hypothetical protein